VELLREAVAGREARAGAQCEQQAEWGRRNACLLWFGPSPPTQYQQFNTVVIFVFTTRSKLPTGGEGIF
jgi:hypothetical protein